MDRSPEKNPANERSVPARAICFADSTWARYGDALCEGKAVLVLGAGNSSTLPLCDTFHKLFVKLQVVVWAPFHRIDPLGIRSRKPQIFARKLSDFEIAPSWFRLVRLMATAVGG